MHVDPVIPGHAFVWGTDGAARGGGTSQPVIYRVDQNGLVTELTRGGEIQAIGDMVVSTHGTIYVVDPTTLAGKVVAIDTQTGSQSVVATGGDVFVSPLSISIVQQRSRIFQVDSASDFNDPNPGDGYPGNSSFDTCLRSAIQEANALGGSFTILLPSGAHYLDMHEEIDVDTNITVVGMGADQTIIHGNNATRAFSVSHDGVLKLKGLTIKDTRSGDDDGGAIFAEGPVATEDVAFQSSFAGGDGGAIWSSASLHIYRTHFSGNTTNADGGAIYVSGNGVTVDRSSFFQNEGVNGGALYINNAEVDIKSSTFYLNASFWEGGAIRTASNLPVRVLHCTLVENEAGLSPFPSNPSSGGIDANGSSALPIIRSSVLTSNTFDGDPTDVMGSFQSGDYSFYSTIDGAAFGSLNSIMVGDNPLFAGAPTQIGVTYAFPPLLTSPIIDAAANDEYPSLDQHGYSRSLDGDGDLSPVPDMGAYEAEGACPADLTGDGVLDFFDVAIFLGAYSAMDPAADFTGDGVFDFFDVSAFLNAFSEGCP